MRWGNDFIVKYKVIKNNSTMIFDQVVSFLLDLQLSSLFATKTDQDSWIIPTICFSYLICTIGDK